MSTFNEGIIAEFRENGGVVESHGFGSDLVLLHTTGARTGEERVNPLMAVADEGSWLIVASFAGAPRHPAWYFNLQANPDATIETGVDEIPVTATDLEGAAYDRAWALVAARSDAFEGYAARAGRRIPVVRLTRR